MPSKHADKYKLIAVAIKENRKKKNISQKELAEKIGVSKSYLSKVEAPNCEKSFSLELLFDIAEALDITLEDLIIHLRK